MISEIGRHVLEVCEIAPGGVLVFFPSYGQMNQMYKQWEDEGFIDIIEKSAKVYLEPNESSRFKRIRTDFENDIENGWTAVLMGVCRGKVSEGLDFSDRAAWAVIVIGIPYAVYYDPKVILKKRYLDEKVKHGW